MSDLNDKIIDWITDTSQRDNGAVFWKDTPDNKRAFVTYGDLRKLILLCEDPNP